MKVALITPANLWYCPFVKIYSRAFDSLSIEYDIITWCRDEKLEEGCIQFVNQRKGKFGKVLAYFDFISFIKKTIKTNKYDRLVIFTSQLCILLLPYLNQKFKKKYIVDYRDLSVEQMTILKPLFKNVLKNSFANFISSPGFIKCLPTGIDYLQSHNFVIDNVKEALSTPVSLIEKEPQDITVLTIGGIRDYSSNIEVVNALANKDHIRVLFVGKGAASARIEEYCKNNDIHNVEFYGYYPKEEEPHYIKNATFMNIYYPRVITHDTALSNRFYNSLIFKRPMIVTSNTTQGDYAKKYNLGLSLDDCKGLDVKLRSWLSDNSNQSYADRCDCLLENFMHDYDIFVSRLRLFVK